MRCFRIVPLSSACRTHKLVLSVSTNTHVKTTTCQRLSVECSAQRQRRSPTVSRCRFDWRSSSCLSKRLRCVREAASGRDKYERTEKSGRLRSTNLLLRHYKSNWLTQRVCPYIYTSRRCSYKAGGFEILTGVVGWSTCQAPVKPTHCWISRGHIWRTSGTV